MSRANDDRTSGVVLAQKQLGMAAFIGRQPDSETKRSGVERRTTA